MSGAGQDTSANSTLPRRANLGVGLFQEQEEKGRQLGVWEVSCIREGWRGMAGRNEAGKPTAWRKRKQDVTSCLPQSLHLGWLVPNTGHLHIQTVAEKVHVSQEKLQERQGTDIS